MYGSALRPRCFGMRPSAGSVDILLGEVALRVDQLIRQEKASYFGIVHWFHEVQNAPSSTSHVAVLAVESCPEGQALDDQFQGKEEHR